MTGIILSFVALNIVLTVVGITTKYATNRDQEILDLQREAAFWRQLFEATHQANKATKQADLERDAEMPSNDEFLHQIYKSMSKTSDTHSGHENTPYGHSSNQTEYVKLSSDVSTLQLHPDYPTMNITTEQIRLANIDLGTHLVTPTKSHKN